MNSKQKKFFKELDKLMKKYGIDKMKGIYEDIPILFNCGECIQNWLNEEAK